MSSSEFRVIAASTYFDNFVIFFNSRAPAIVGGADARPGQFPYQLSLKFGNENKCGAVLINYHLAITAAHCCDHILKYKNEIWSVVAGEHIISNREKTEQVRIRI